MRTRIRALAIAAVVLAGCSAPAPVSPGLPAPTALSTVVTPSPGASPTPVPDASPSVETGVPFDVRMAGKIGCAQFPYWCLARVSILEPDATFSSTWRPPDTDPRWLAGSSDSVYSADQLQPVPVDSPPALAPGRHLVVVSLLGFSDLVSFNPDGSLATDLLARCSAMAEVLSGASPPTAVVTFEPDEATFGGTCSIEIDQP